MTTNFITTAEFREFNPTMDLSNYTDTTLSGVITRATAKVETYLGYTLPQENVVDEKALGHVNANGDLVIYPRKRPVTAVSAVTVVKGNVALDIDLSQTGVDIPSRANEIVINGYIIYSQNVSTLWYAGSYSASMRFNDFFIKTSYTAGFDMADRPQDIMDAVNLYAREDIARSFNSSGADEIRQGAVTIKYSTSSRAGGSDSDNIRDAKEILNDYKRVSGF